MRRRFGTKLLALAFVFSCHGWAEDDEAGRGVARISLIHGDVSVRRGDSGDWIAAAINTPLVSEDHVLTGADSRAEIQLDYARMLRLDSNSEVRMADLEGGRYQAQVARGTVMLSVLRDSKADMELDTPNVSVRPQRKGDYRITVREDGESEITVRTGEAEVFTPTGSQRLTSGRTMLVRGSPSDPEFQMVNAVEYDDWDRWNQDRDKMLQRSRSYEYVSRDIYGADDLDLYGRWIYAPPYGWVWAPNAMGPDWAPYRYGRWSWIDYYGWTWVDYAPWGWAPYHYGRWFWGAPYGWCWYPGPIYGRHYWRPALVGFFGFGAGNFGVGFGFGNVGWVPLAPYERFHPWYGRGIYRGYRNGVYVDNSIRIVNNVNIRNTYRNARVMNGVTGIGSHDFVLGRSGRAIRATDAGFERASAMRGALPLTPSSQSLRVSDRNVRMANLPRTERTQFFSPRPARAIERVPFDRQRQGMEQMVQRTFGGPGGGGRVVAQGNRGVESPRGTGGLSRADMTNQPSQGWRRSDQPFGAQPSQPGGRNWTRFGTRPQTESAAGGGPSQRMEPGRNRADSVPRNEPRMSPSTERGGDNWHRFGGASQAPDRGARPAENRQMQDRPMNRGGSARPQSENRFTQGGSNGNWNRFEARPSESGARSMGAPGRADMRSQPRSEAPRWNMGGRERINVNPPIIRERSAPSARAPFGGGEMRGGGVRSGGGEMRGGGGGHVQAAPRGGGMSRSGGGGGRGRSR